MDRAVHTYCRFQPDALRFPPLNPTVAGLSRRNEPFPAWCVRRGRICFRRRHTPQDNGTLEFVAHRGCPPLAPETVLSASFSDQGGGDQIARPQAQFGGLEEHVLRRQRRIGHGVWRLGGPGKENQYGVRRRAARYPARDTRLSAMNSILELNHGITGCIVDPFSSSAAFRITEI